MSKEDDGLEKSTNLGVISPILQNFIYVISLDIVVAKNVQLLMLNVINVKTRTMGCQLGITVSSLKKTLN